VLFNSGVCFEKAKAFQNAINVREVLVKNYPTERTAKQSLYALGVNKAAIGEFACPKGAPKDCKQAAEYFEQYASKFSGESDAPKALSQAVFFRKGVGHDEDALDDTKDFVKLYMGKQPAEAANAFFSMAGIYEKNRKYDDLVDHLGEYLKRFGTKGGVDRQIIAHAKMGEVLWRQSCTVRGPLGACVEVTRARANKAKKKKSTRRTQCGADSKIKLSISDRKPKLVKEARGHFEAAVKLWKGGKADGDVPGKEESEKTGRTAEMRYWLAASKFYLAEQKYEDFLKIKFPEKLDFDEKKPGKAKDSKKRFGKWLTDRTKALQTAKTLYLEIVDLQPHWGVAAAARVGQMYQNYADAVFSAEIPKDVAAYEDAAEVYCDVLAEEADKLETEAVTAYTFCLETSLKLSWFNEYSQTCETELSQIRPQDFPTAGEIRATPDEIPLTLDTANAMAEIKK
jgi:hypothetical protein